MAGMREESLTPASANMERRLKELSAINRVGAAISSALDLNSLCRMVGNCLLEIFETGIVFVALYDTEEGIIRTPFFAIDGTSRTSPPFVYGNGLSTRVIQSRKPLYFPTQSDCAEASKTAILLTQKSIKSWLGVPMMGGKEVVGVLSVQSFDREEAFSENDITLLSTLASTLGARVQSVRLFEAVSRRAEEAAAVAETGRWISESLDLDTVLGRISERAALLLTKSASVVYLAEGGFLKPVAVSGPLSEALREDSVPLGEGILGRVYRTGRPETVNNTFMDPDSVRVPDSPPDEMGEKLMVAPLLAEARVIGLMAIWRGSEEPVFKRADLAFLSSLARQAEVAIQNARLHAGVKEANRLKSRFLASMSHELRTPLNSIINFAYLLLVGSEGGLTEGQADLVKRIEDAGGNLLGLINDILDLSKIESGRMELRFEEVDFLEVAESVLSTATGLVRGKPIGLLRDYPKDLPPLVADRTRLRQILLNLLSNAVKFTEKGQIRLGARIEGEEMLITVEDTGIGMPSVEIPKAFEEFVQLDGGLARAAGGTGLGLPLARNFAELHGGHIRAESTPGRGSRFIVSLPLAGPPAARLASSRLQTARVGGGAACPEVDHG
jgi:signal transduction histidine kinase